MSYTLFLGDRSYSSWSLRGWLLFEKFGLTATSTFVDFKADASVAKQMNGTKVAATVPTMISPEGAEVYDSLAIAEELATRHPEAAIWPAEPRARGAARAMAAEMHASFTALREYCPMNLRAAYKDVPVPEAVTQDLRRLEVIWDHARESLSVKGPWLCGEYSAVDAFFAPVAARIAGYGLPVSASAADYVAAHLADPSFRRWRAMGLAEGADLQRYAKDYPQMDWPGPKPIAAKAVSGGRAENAKCPYSGAPCAHFLEVGGRTFGTCNAFCRDKTVADPEAWPEFMALL